MLTMPGLKARGLKTRRPGGDWIRLQPNGNWKLDPALFHGDDGSAIHCFYNGVLRMEPHIAEGDGKGEEIDGNDMYFRATPYFETQSEKYAWLNDIVTVGRMRKLVAAPPSMIFSR